MRLFLVTVIVFCMGTVAYAGPFMVSDPNPGATEYEMEVEGTVFIVPAQADGSFRYDLSTWTLGSGTFNGEIRNVAIWEMTDNTSGETSSVKETSVAAPFVLKVPANNAAVNNRLTE